MGEIMQQMARSRQIIAITHLPQIAAMGDAQFKVYKQDTDRRTETSIRLLSQDERIEEIASMLSGSTPTPAARDNALQLLRR
jgi:DNA repair protein RecN (Recombination protein N)